MDVDVVLGAYDAFRGWFWNKTFWLPANRTWADLRRSDAPGSPFYPDIYDLLVVFPIAVVLFLARLLWERYACVLQGDVPYLGPVRLHPPLKSAEKLKVKR